MMRLIRVRSVLLLLATLLWCGTSAHAQGGSTRVNDVSVTLITDWPEGLMQGYQPVRLQLINKAESPRRISIELQSNYARSTRVQQDFVLDGHGQLTTEILLPSFDLSQLQYWGNDYTLLATSGGKREALYGIFGNSGGGPTTAGIMVYRQDRLEAGKQEAWEALIAGAGPKVYSLRALTFDRMPSNAAAYSSLKCVVVDLSRGVPTPEKLQPLLAQARLGGTVAFLGLGAITKASGHELLAPWMEERFALSDSDFEASESMLLRACGLGLLVFADTQQELFEFSEVRSAIRLLTENGASFVPSSGDRHFSSLEIPGIAELPYGVFVALLILFALLIGPVNFILVRRTGKPALLLLTIPVISITASLLLLAYGIFSQGLDTKASSLTLTLLDQRAERIDVVEDRRLFVGLATEPGLRPAAGTTCYPVEVKDDNPQFLISLGEPTLLAGSFYESREEMHQRFLSERTSRLRLVVEKSGAGYRITNGFSCGISNFLMRDAQGDAWSFDGQLGAGESVDLQAFQPKSGRGSIEQMFASRFNARGMSNAKRLFPGSYCLELEENLFQDDCGLNLNVIGGRYGLIGILELGDVR